MMDSKKQYLLNPHADLSGLSEIQKQAVVDFAAWLSQFDWSPRQSETTIDLPPIEAEIVDYADRMKRLFLFDQITKEQIERHLFRSGLTMRYTLQVYLDNLARRGYRNQLVK